MSRTCDICGAEKVKGQVNYGNIRGTRTWWTCPFSHREIELKLTVEHLEKEREGLKWGVVAERGDKREIITVGHTRERAEYLRDQLAENGRVKTSKKAPGFLVLPGDMAREAPGFKKRHESAKVTRVPKPPKPQKRKKRTVAEQSEKKKTASIVTEEMGKEVVRLRHQDRLSWKLIAEKTGLGSPGKARSVYTAHSGVSHKEAPEVIRINSGDRDTSESMAARPLVFDEDVSDEDVLRKVKKGAVLSVRYETKTENYTVGRVEGVKEGKSGRYVTFTDDAHSNRSIRLQQIVRIA